MIHIDTKDIFDCIRKEATNTASLLAEYDDDNLQESKKLFESFRSGFAEQAAELEQNTQWDSFSIAFYGETNAGKSTLIEALRIYFKEPSKLEQQERFKDRWTHLQERLVGIKDMEQKLHNELEAMRQELEELEKAYEQDRAGFWGWLKCFVGLSKHKRRMLQMRSKHAKARCTLETFLRDDHCKQARDSAMPELLSLCDGATVGAKTDFTKVMIPYRFAINNESVQLLDVPGIEGKEEGLKSEIKKAMQQAHCVLVLVRDKIEDGTLEMIKQGLGDQTEVFVVFNKSATSPHALKPVEPDKQMQQMTEKVKNALPQSYKDAKYIYALPALLSQASCLLPSEYIDETNGSSITQGQQDKFLFKKEGGDDTLDKKQQLSQVALFDDFAAFVANLATDTKDKMRRNIFTKANAILGEFGSVIKKLSSNFADLFSKTEQNIDSLESNIDKICDSNRLRFHSIISNELRDFINKVRKKIYDKIGENIKDDEFREYTQSTLQDRLPTLEAKLAGEMDKQSQELHQNLQDEFKDFERKSNNDLANFKQTLSQNLSGMLSFGEIDSGISWAGLAGVGVGAVGTAFGAAALIALGPAGWAVLAMGAIGLVISAYKSIRKFFSDSYKQAEQRKSLAKALDALQEDITDQCSKSIEAYIQEVQEQYQKQRQIIAEESKKLAASAKMLEAIQDKITTLQADIMREATSTQS